MAAIAVGSGYDDGDVAAGQVMLDSMVESCPELDEVGAADLFAGVFTVIERDESSAAADRVMSELPGVLAGGSGMSCQDVAGAYVGTVIG